MYDVRKRYGIGMVWYFSHSWIPDALRDFNLSVFFQAHLREVVNQKIPVNFSRISHKWKLWHCGSMAQATGYTFFFTRDDDPALLW